MAICAQAQQLQAYRSFGYLALIAGAFGGQIPRIGVGAMDGIGFQVRWIREQSANNTTEGAGMVLSKIKVLIEQKHTHMAETESLLAVASH